MASSALFNTQKCSYLLLLFPCLAYDLLHVDVGSDLVVRAYDEQLVRKLIEKITVYDDHLNFLFKSGIQIEIKG